MNFGRHKVEGKKLDNKRLLKKSVPAFVDTTRKKHAPVGRENILGLRKSAGKSIDVSRSDSPAVNSFDPALFSSIEEIHSLGIENYIAQENLSLLSFQDLRKKLENLNFSPGLLKDNMYAIKQKLKSSQFCTISADVYSISPEIQFDDVSEVFTGFVAPLCSEMRLATEIVVFFLQGFEVEWKSLAGYMLVNFEEDGWAVWHTLNQMILLLAQYDFTVINVIFGDKLSFDLFDNNVDETVLKSDSVVQHPCYESGVLCFSKNVDDLVKSVCACLLQSNLILPDEMLTKYELKEKSLVHRHLQIIIGDTEVSSEKIAFWLFQRDRDFPHEDEFPELKTDIFIIRMLWMWVNAMTFVTDDDTLGFYSAETHIQTLRDTSWIFEVMEKSAGVQSDALLWSSMRRSTVSALSLYDHYVVKGLVSCMRFNSFRSISLHHLKDLMKHDDLAGNKPKACSMLLFLRLVNSALLLHPNYAENDFVCGEFLSEFLKHRRIHSPTDIEEFEDLSDIEGLGLYYLSSRIITKLVGEKNCEKCKAALVTDQIASNVPQVWTEAVDVKGFFHPSMSVYDTLQWAESHFVNLDEDILRFHKPCTQLAYRIYGEMSFSIRNTFPPCHEILRQMLRAFMSIRLKMVAKDLTKRLK